MQWPRLAPPTKAIVTSGWASSRTIGTKQGIHGSLDFANDLNDPILAVAAGEVVAAGSGSGETGKYVLLKHTFPGGLILLSRYIHLNAVNVATGQKVRQGAVIGYAGNSGAGGAVHLHFDSHVCGETALQSYKQTFGWPTTTKAPLIKGTLPGCYLVPSEPLVKVSGYRDGVITQAAAYGLTLFPNRTDRGLGIHPAVWLLVTAAIGGAVGALLLYKLEVPRTGVEPARDFSHQHLKLGRLP